MNNKKITNFLSLWLAAVTLLFLPACEKEFVTTQDDKEAIEIAIIKYDLALVRMYRRLDINELNGFASSAEIGKNNAIIFGFSADNIYMESQFLDLRVDDVRIISPGKADASVWEKWKWRHLNIETREVVKPWVEKETALKYHMVKDKKLGKWIVDEVAFVDKPLKKEKDEGLSGADKREADDS